MASKATDIITGFMMDWFVSDYCLDGEQPWYVSIDDLKEAADANVAGDAAEFYDRPHYALLATPAIANALDWDTICERVNEARYDAAVQQLFEDD